MHSSPTRTVPRRTDAPLVLNEDEAKIDEVTVISRFSSSHGIFLKKDIQVTVFGSN